METIMSRTQRRNKVRHLALSITCLFMVTGPVKSVSLPDGYFRLMEAGSMQVEARLDSEPNADLERLESKSGWRHFPSVHGR